jgi:hypothetical protein
MRYLIIENGVATNAAVADEPLGDNWVQSDKGNIGDLYDGVNFTAPPMPQDVIDKAWVELRNRRDSLLGLCDWTQLIDTPLTDVERLEWAEYRQALRDLPSSIDDPLDFIWPTAPQT